MLNYSVNHLRHGYAPLSQTLTEQNKYFCHEMSFLFYMQPAQTTHYLTEKSAFTFAIHAKQHAKK